MNKNFVDPSLKQCDKRYCYIGNKDNVFFADLDHLSLFGTYFFSDIFNEVFSSN